MAFLIEVILRGGQLRMNGPSCKSILRLLIFVSLLSNKTMTFYVISSSDCEPCEERFMMVQGLYSESVFIRYEVAESVNLKRFKEITSLIGEVYIPLPLFGVFVSESLKMIVAGGLSAAVWEDIMEEEIEGVPIYVDDGRGGAELKIIIEDMMKIERMRELFSKATVRSSPENFKSLIVPVFVAAVMDAVNPCSISVLLVLLTFVFYGVGRRAVLRTGIAFSIAVFITYFSMGLGIIRAFSLIPHIEYVVVAWAIFFGALRIIEFITGEKIHLPGAFAKEITKYLERASNPWTGFIAGVVSASLLLPCSSAPYFLALNLLSEKASLPRGILLLAIYNLIIVSPFLFLTVCIHSLGVKTMDLKLWIAEKRRWIDLVVGLGLIGLSLIVLFT